MTGGVEALRTFVVATLKANMDRVAELNDPYFNGRIEEAEKLIAESCSRIAAVKSVVGTPTSLVFGGEEHVP